MKPIFSKSPSPSSSSQELIKLIQSHGKSIGMPSWEIQEFLDICVRLHKLDLGKDILQDYLKLQQDIEKLNAKRSSYRVKIFQFFHQKEFLSIHNEDTSSPFTSNRNMNHGNMNHGSISNGSTSYGNMNHGSTSYGSMSDEQKNEMLTELSRYLMKLAEYSLKSWIAICRLRQLQWAPHPITLSVNNGNQTSFLLEYQNDIKQLFQMLQEHQIRFSYSQENWIYLLILVATSAASHQEDLLLTLDNYFIHSENTKPWSLDLHQFFLNLMKEIILHELQSYEISQVCHSLSPPPPTEQIPTIHTATSPSLSQQLPPSGKKESFPILKISYEGKYSRSVLQNRSDDRCRSSWSLGVRSDEGDPAARTDVYVEGAKVLLYYFYSHFTENSKREVNDPHLVHANNLAKINEEHLNSHQKRPSSGSTFRNVETDKKHFLPLTIGETRKKNRPQSSPMISSKRIEKKKNFVAAPRLVVAPIGNDARAAAAEFDGHDKSEQGNLSSLSYDESGTYDLSRVTLGSPPIPEDEPSPQPNLSHKALDANISREYESANDVNAPFRNQVSLRFCFSSYLAPQDGEELKSPKQTRQKRSLTAPPQLSPLMGYLSPPQHVSAHKKILNLQKSDSWNSFSSPSPSAQIKSPSTQRSHRKKEILIQTKICAINGTDISLEISRVKFQSLSSPGDSASSSFFRLLVTGYHPSCPSSTRYNCLIGDEIVSINDISVEGKQMRDVTKALMSSGRGGMSPLKGYTSPLSSRRQSSVVSNPMVNIQFRRYYPDWEKYAPHLSSSAVTASPVSENGNATPSASPINESGTAPVLLEYEKRLQELKNEIAISEQNVLICDVDNFLSSKEIILKKYDEFRELQEEYFDKRAEIKQSSHTNFHENLDRAGSEMTKDDQQQCFPFFSPATSPRGEKGSLPISAISTTQRDSSSISDKSEEDDEDLDQLQRGGKQVKDERGMEGNDSQLKDFPRPRVAIIKGGFPTPAQSSRRIVLNDTSKPKEPQSGHKNGSTDVHRNEVKKHKWAGKNQGRKGAGTSHSTSVLRPSQMDILFDDDSLEDSVDSGREPPISNGSAVPSSKKSPTATAKNITSPAAAAKLSYPHQTFQSFDSYRLPSASSKDVPANSSFSSSRGFLRSNKRSNVIALRESLQFIKLKYQNSPLRLISKMKIYSWWKLISPQRKLEHRLWVRDMCLEWLYDVFDIAYEKTIRARRIRRNMLREAAAIKIQRRFRHWKFTVLSKILRIQRVWRRYSARKVLWKLITMTRAAILVARFLYFRKRRLRQPVGKKNLYKRVICSFIEIVGFRSRDARQQLLLPHNIPAHILRRTGTNALFNHSKPRRNDIYQKREKASTRIQALFRMRLAVKSAQELKRELSCRRQVVRALVLVRLKRKMRWRKKMIEAATRIASFWRGCAFRWMFMIRILAGIRITSCWRKYKEYWKLKRCLRRIEIPLNIVLHGIKNLPSSQINSKSIKVRVSVWWTGLLHLVGEGDFETVIKSKPPNIVRTTSFHPCVEQTRPNFVPSLSPSSSLSTMSLSSNNLLVQQSPLQSLSTPISINGAQRRLSMAQRTQLLTPHESCRTLTASEQLVEFARLNGVQGAAIKTSGYSNDKRKSISAFTKSRFASAVKRTTVMRHLSKVEENSAVIKDDSSSSSSSSGDSDSDQDEQKGSDEEEERGKKIAREKRENISPLPTVIKRPVGPKHRLSFDGIGRESVNSLGTNLLPEMDHSDQVTSFLSQSKAVTPSLNSMQPHRQTIEPTSQPAPPQGFIGNAIQALKGTSFNGLFESNSNLDTFLRNTNLKYSVSLEDESLYIPGCHGNSVIRFDFYSGSVKFGTNIYQLSSDQSLMFWGGEMTREITMLNEKTLPRVSQQQQHSDEVKVKSKKSLVKVSSPVDFNSVPSFELKIAAGAPTRSKCGWCMVSASGNGPLKRRMRKKGFLKSFFETWDRLFISLDGEFFLIYSSRNATEPLFFLSLSDIKNIRLELAENHREVNRHANTMMEDKFVIVLSTTSWDSIKLSPDRFQEPFVRESWVRIFVQAIDYHRDILTKRLLSNPMFSQSVSNTGRSNASDTNKKNRRR